MNTTAEYEIHAQRRQTQAMIDAAPVEVTVTRTVWLEDGSGGHYPGDASELRPQRFAVLRNNSSALPIRTNVDGTQVTPSFTLEGRWDADIERGDHFVLDGETYVVVFIQPVRTYQTLAEVAQL